MNSNFQIKDMLSSFPEVGFVLEDRELVRA